MSSEGIALLSMYGDDDEDIEENTPHQQEHGGTSSQNVTLQPSLFLPQQQRENDGLDLNCDHIRNNRLSIVDYGYEDGAMSPEAEEEEVAVTGPVMYGEMLQTTDGEFGEKKSSNCAAPKSLDQPESHAMIYNGVELESARTENAVMFSIKEQKYIDPLDKFLPPPPMAKCSDEVQEKIIKFLALKKSTGRSFNAEVRNRKEYRNPDFLVHAVTYQNIDQVGSCFSKDVFDPHGYAKADFYDKIIG